MVTIAIVHALVAIAIVLVAIAIVLVALGSELRHLLPESVQLVSLILSFGSLHLSASFECMLRATMLRATTAARIVGAKIDEAKLDGTRIAGAHIDIDGKLHNGSAMCKTKMGSSNNLH